jgi:hypothetical protein
LIEKSETPSLPFDTAGLVSRGKGESVPPPQGAVFGTGAAALCSILRRRFIFDLFSLHLYLPLHHPLRF